MKLYDIIRKEGIEQGHLPPLEEGAYPEVPKHRTYTRERRPFSWKKIFVITLAISFVVFLYIAGMKVVRATVVVTERRIPFSLDGAEFEILHQGDVSANRLSFQTMVVPAEVSRQVYGSEVQQSTSVAKGKVVFFNEYSTKAQTIKAKTTLVGANKKSYQTTQAVTVPGYTLKGKIKTPGTSVATPITATAVGPSFNTSGTSFTVSGWGKQLYAQSAGDIAGGEQGVVHSISAAAQADVVATLQAQLTERLKRETRAQIPETLITFPDLQLITIDSNSIQLKGDSVKFPASIKGSMTTYLISRDLLETAIAKYILNDRSYAHVSIPTLSDLTVTAVSALPTDPKNTPDSIRIKISGEGTIITKAPVLQIQQSLVGAPKRNFGTILASVPEVDTATYRFYPFWAPFFPSKDARITIKTQ